MREDLSDKEKAILERLSSVLDPEIGLPITAMGLVDDVRVEGKKAKVVYHLSAPFCPPPLAIRIGEGIIEKALEEPGIEEVEVQVQGHVYADMINAKLRGLAASRSKKPRGD